MTVNSHNIYESTQGGPDTDTQATIKLFFSSLSMFTGLQKSECFRKHLRAGDCRAGALVSAQSRL